jgi:D-arabinose 1-dehydrogenase-like Zn-dependent alcohol dehydrogenase
MKAAVLTDPGSPLQIMEVPDPEPGPGQVRIRVRVAGVCGTDLSVVRGHFPAAMPIVPGHEVLGVVERLGPDVANLRPGDRVGVPWFQAFCGHCESCLRGTWIGCRRPRRWIENGGGFAELMVAEASGCVIVPEDLSDQEAAVAFCSGFTVMSGYRRARPQPRDRVCVLGIGGLGHLALQIAKSMGHDVVAITSSEQKRSDARRFGADEVLVAADGVGERLAAIGGADVLLWVSSAPVKDILLGLRPEGRVVVIAAAGKLEVSSVVLLQRQISIIGATQDRREDLADYLRLAASGRVKPVVEVHRLDEVNRALQRLAEGTVRYRGLVQMPDAS